MVNSWHTYLIFVVFSVIIFDSNYAAVRERRGLIFGNKNDQTTTRTIIKSPLGFVSVSVAGGQKAPENPCNPSPNTEQSTGRKPLINIKVPLLFNKGNNQGTTFPPECTSVSESPSTETPQPTPSSSIPTKTPAPKPPSSSPHPPVPSTVPAPTTSGHITASSTIDPDDELINSIFGEETGPATSENNGAGLLGLRKPLS